MAPPYVDEDPNMEMVEKGLRIAENEKRDAVTDGYEEAALSSSDPEEALDDISYPTGTGKSANAELSAIRKADSPNE